MTDIGAEFFEDISSHTNTNSKRSVDMNGMTTDRTKRVGGGGRIAKAGRLGQKSVANQSALNSLNKSKNLNADSSTAFGTI